MAQPPAPTQDGGCNCSCCLPMHPLYFFLPPFPSFLPSVPPSMQPLLPYLPLPLLHITLAPQQQAPCTLQPGALSLAPDQPCSSATQLAQLLQGPAGAMLSAPGKSQDGACQQGAEDGGGVREQRLGERKDSRLGSGQQAGAEATGRWAQVGGKLLDRLTPSAFPSAAVGGMN